MKRVILVVLAIVSVSGFVLAGGQNGSGSATSDVEVDYSPFGRYSETVVMNIGRESPVQSNLPPEDSMEDNLYLRHILKRLNIDINYSWLTDVSTYDQKVNLVIASGDIPDVMEIRNQTQLNQLVEAGMVEDVTEPFNRTMSPYLAAIYDSYGDRKTDTAMFDGRIMAIPDVNPGYQFALLWLRKDWMDMVGAKPPETLDEIADLARQFIEQDPGGNGPGGTIGITANPTVAGVYNALHSLDPVFGAFGSFPRQWIPDGSGSYVYGSITDSTKEALAKVAEWYAAGLIDPEFAVHKTDDENAILAGGRGGIMFGPWWMPYWPLNDSVNNNRDADWWPYMTPLDQNRKYNVYYQNPHFIWMVVRKGYSNPEALVRVLNVQYEGIRQIDKEAAEFYKDMNVNWAHWPLPLLITADDTIPVTYQNMRNALDAKDPSSLAADQQGIYENILKNSENPRADVAAWSAAQATGEGMRVAATPNIVTFADNKFPGQTPTMELKWPNLAKLEDEALLKIIMGVEPISYFDTFVEQWKSQGGDEITEEVNKILR